MGRRHGTRRGPRALGGREQEPVSRNYRLRVSAGLFDLFTRTGAAAGNLTESLSDRRLGGPLRERLQGRRGEFALVYKCLANARRPVLVAPVRRDARDLVAS